MTTPDVASLPTTKETPVNPRYDFTGQVALVTGASLVVGVALPVDGGYTAR